MINLKVVILQPSYLPWLGYFGMIDISDVFIFYDDAQFSKQSWQQRNKIKTSNKWTWLVVPVYQELNQRINEVKISNNTKWFKKHWKSILFNYNKAPFFNNYKEIFENIYNTNWEYLMDLNITIIKKLSKLLGLNDAKFLLSSELNVRGNKTDRLINILTKIGADQYISGPAAKDYIELEKFNSAEIELFWFEYNHPKYNQLYDDFISHLSIIDLLFNMGEDSIQIIRKGNENSLIKAK